MAEEAAGPSLVARLRRLGERPSPRGSRLRDRALLAAVALAATVAALALSLTTPMRAAENLTADMRVSVTAPPNRTPLVIVKIDDAAIDAMRDASPCHCLSPIDKSWLAGVVAVLEAKGVRAVGIDYLLDAWRTPEELARFTVVVAAAKAPVAAAADPALKPGVDYPVVPGLRYVDARALASDDYDNVVRRYTPRPHGVPALATGLAEAVGGRVGSETFAIRYRAPDPAMQAENAGAIAPSYSAAYVDALPAAFFRGKIALIGEVTRSAHAEADTLKEDMHMTPLRFRPGHYAGTPGVEVHAHALSQMLAGDRLITPGVWVAALLTLLTALGGALLGRSTQSWWASVAIVLLALAAGAVLGALALQLWGVMAPLVTPALAFALAFFVLSRLTAARLQSDRALYSGALARYLAPQVINRLVEGREPIRIGADERDITVIVTDLENFSSLAAETPLEEFSRVINGYFGGLIDILWKHEAMIDKMTGDGLIALFGAPVPQPDHADRALACAREIDAFGERFRAESLAQGRHSGRTRVGISSGPGLVGNFGGERRFNYTAYGQVVVIAARLEAANKGCDTSVLFDASTLERARNPGAIRPVGDLRLKGVPQAIAGYTLA